MDRRKFLRTLGIAGAAAAIPWKFDTRTYKLMMARAYPFAQSPTNIRKFVTTLPGLGPGGANNIGQYIPLATKTTQTFAGLSTDVYNLGVTKFGEKMHPDLKRATHFWGYYDLGTGDQKYLGGVIVAKRGYAGPVQHYQPAATNLIPIDPTIMAGYEPTTVGQLPPNRIATHLHGGLTPWFSDGTPFQWFDPKRDDRSQFHERSRHESACRHRDLLLPHGPERQVRVVPRPRHRDHPHQCLRRDCLGLDHHG